MRLDFTMRLDSTLVKSLLHLAWFRLRGKRDLQASILTSKERSSYVSGYRTRIWYSLTLYISIRKPSSLSHFSPISSSNDKAKSDEASQGAKISKRVIPMSIIDHQTVVRGRPIQPTVLPIFAVARRNGLSAFSELESLNGRRHAAMVSTLSGSSFKVPFHSEFTRDDKRICLLLFCETGSRHPDIVHLISPPYPMEVHIIAFPG